MQRGHTFSKTGSHLVFPPSQVCHMYSQEHACNHFKCLFSAVGTQHGYLWGLDNSGLRDVLYGFGFVFLDLFVYFETGFLCVALEPVLELALVDQAGLELTEILLLCLLSAGIKGVHQHRPAKLGLLYYRELHSVHVSLCPGSNHLSVLLSPTDNTTKK